MRRVLALAAPFLGAAALAYCLARQAWLGALAATAALTFFSYGSTSHDLVHRNLGLPHRLNEVLLSVIEGLTLRSGHAYRLSHLNHHAHFPERVDVEGLPAHDSLPRVLLGSPIYVWRLWLWSWRQAKSERRWILAETAWAVTFVVAALLLFRRIPQLAEYAALVMAGTWVFPVGLVYVQHDAAGKNELFQTRAWRGRLIPVLLLNHLFHLEHHLYPMVPAHHWKKLSKRLEPFLEQAGVVRIRIP